MKLIQSKWFHWFLGIGGVGGSLYSLYRFGHWEHLSWPGIKVIVIPLLMMGIEMFARAERLKRICRLVGHEISLRKSIWINAVGDIYGAATPSSVGGEISRIAALTRFKLKTYTAMVTLAADRFMLMTSLTMVMIGAGAFILIHDPAQLSIRSLLYTLGVYILLAIGLIIFLVGSIRKKKMIFNWKQLLMKPDIFLLASVHHVIRLGTLPVILCLISGEKPTPMIWVWSFILNYGVSLVPIPSGGGSMEITFMGIFTSMIGVSTAGTILIWWRLTTHYFYVITSLFVTMTGFIFLSRRKHSNLAK